MKKSRIKNSCLAFLFILLSCSANNKGEENTPAEKMNIEGTFIQSWLCGSWSDAQWDAEFKALKEAGMKYLIMAPMLQTDEEGDKSSVYPSSWNPSAPDVLETLLRSAKRNDFKVFLGINMNERWWRLNYDDKWLYEQMEEGNKVIDEILAKYKSRYEETLYGWYWVWEVDNLNCNTSECRTILANCLNINLDHLSKVCPDMPLMLSPFMNYRVGVDASGYGQMWKEVFAKAQFRKGDIFAPQDCCGAGGLTTDMLREWFGALKAAVDTKKGLLFWTNVENFEQHSWTSAPMNRYAKQIETERPFVSGMITFAYSHYYSPNTCNGKLHEAYSYYVKEGVLPEIALPEAVSNVLLKRSGEETHLSWNLPDKRDTFLGVHIYKNGSWYRTVQSDKNGNCSLVFTETTALNDSDVFEVASFNAVGAESEKVKANRIVSP
ncbi:MAG: DUF4434 domain-containing protein [Dysgonamonadaceae bacterium]|jgi:hypothetical protein|nr:DUF4434 domain-containing protein [Dysgonamonadaceae bacterium]